MGGCPWRHRLLPTRRAPFVVTSACSARCSATSSGNRKGNRSTTPRNACARRRVPATSRPSRPSSPRCPWTSRDAWCGRSRSTSSWPTSPSSTTASGAAGSTPSNAASPPSRSTPRSSSSRPPACRARSCATPPRRVSLELVLTAHPDRGHASHRAHRAAPDQRTAAPPRRPAALRPRQARHRGRPRRADHHALADRRDAHQAAARRRRDPPRPVVLRAEPVRRRAVAGRRLSAPDSRSAAAAALRQLDRRRSGRQPERRPGDAARRGPAGARAGAAPLRRRSARPGPHDGRVARRWWTSTRPC